uniref:TATA-box binding protein associated factor 4b n=1 Tax=Leptobrachium leishanense TaxID=445787 RepID=A0A8C5MD98_9ANUR
MPIKSTATSGNIVKVSPSMVGGQSAIPAMPTIVKISKPSTPHSGLTNHGTSTIIIRTRVPDATAVPACLPAAAPTSTVSPVAVQTSSGTSPMRTLIPLPTPVTTSACTAAVIPVKTVISSSSAALPTPISVKIVNSAGTPTNGATTPSPVTQTASNNDSVVKLPITVGTPVTSVVGNGSQVISSAPVQTTLCITPAVCVDKVPATVTAQVPTTSPNLVISKVEPAKVTPTAQTTNSTETMDNVKKCKNFLATLIKLASSGPQSPTMGQNVKNLVQNLLDSKLEPEEFTGKLYKELKSSPQPYLVPFLKKSLPALRRLMPNSQEFISQCGQQNPPSISVSNTPGFVKIIATSTMPSVKQIGTTLCGVKANQVPSAPVQPINNMKTVNMKQLVVQQPSSGILKHVTTIPPTSMCAIQKPGEKRITLNALIQAGQLQPATVKQVLLPENKVISLQATRVPIKESGAACFRDEDDINDVTSMAGVNLNEENACILGSNSQYVGAVIRSCHEEPFLFTSALQNRILEIGKRHDIKELNSNVMNLVSHATQERLRGLIEKLTVAAQHRSMNYKQSDRYHQSSDVRAQLKYFEQLEQLEKQRRNEEEREMLLRAARSRSNKEDPEHLRLKQKAKEMQQLELEQLQYREANLAALAAIGPRRKRPLDSIHLQNGLEDANGVFGLSRPALLQKRTRVCLRDLIFCMEQDRATRYSLSIYRALLK